MDNKIKISNFKNNPTNPRVIKDDKFNKLIKSIQEFPEMMEKRPMVCVTDIDGKLYPLGGNMRLKAIKEIGYNEIPETWVSIADNWTQEKRNEFVIKDNIGYGEWDWENLANEWDSEKLEEWGLDLPIDTNIDKSEENEILHFEKSLQILPKQEYIIITAPEDSSEWEELKTIFSCGIVRQGGCKIGSTSDKATTGLERVFDLKTFKERVTHGLYISNAK